MSIRIIPNRFDESPFAFLEITRCFLRASHNALSALKRHFEEDESGFRYMGDLIVEETHLSQLRADYHLFREHVPEPERLKGPYVIIIKAETLQWHDADVNLEQYLGYSLSELENDWVIAYHPESCEETDEEMTGILRDFHQGKRNYAEIDVRYQTKPGYSVWAQVTFSLVRDWKGNPEYYMMVIRDVSMVRWVQLFYEQLLHIKELMEASGFYSESLQTIDGLLRHYDGEVVDRQVMTQIHALVSDSAN